MRKRLYTVSAILTAFSAVYLLSCNNSTDQKTMVASETKTLTKEELIKRGDYLTTLCNDCHSPKVMTQMGPVPDSTKLLSGHPSTIPLLPIDTKSLQPGNWITMSPDITAFVGPWGISYAANLTPDSATGIGAWSEATFVSAMRNGKHMGNGRPIMPPMPWQGVAKLTDEDLKAVYTYLQSLPAISNKVPEPVAPPDAMKMGAK